MIERAADRVFAPLDSLARKLQQDGGEIPESLWSVVAVFGVGSMIVAVAAALGAFAAYEVLGRVRDGLRRVLRSTCRGTDQDRMRTAAEVFIRYDTAIGALRARTNVLPSLPQTQPRTLGQARTLAERGRAMLLRQVISVPAHCAGLVRGLAWRLRHPVGVYLALGAIWVVYRPELDRPAGLVTSLVDATASPFGVAVLAAGAAAAAVLLDHGLGPRLRGRNAYVRETATEAERALGAMRFEAEQVIETLDSAIDELIAAHPHNVSSAVQHATGHRYTVVDGMVTKALASSPRRCDAFGRRQIEWASENPLARYQLPTSEGACGDWDPAAPLNAALDRLTHTIPDERMYRATLAQAPRAAYSVVGLARWRFTRGPSGACEPDAARYRVVERLRGERLERAGRDLIKQIERDISTRLDEPMIEVQRVIQQLVDAETDRQFNALWEAYECRARLWAFIVAMHRRHHPRGHSQRLGSA